MFLCGAVWYGKCDEPMPREGMLRESSDVVEGEIQAGERSQLPNLEWDRRQFASPQAGTIEETPVAAIILCIRSQR
jgi:hypothetical protein